VSEQVEAVQMEPSQYGIFIGFEFADGGALMYAQTPRGKRSAVIAGDPISATFQRKVQRTAVRWAKEFFVAPERQKKDVVPTPEGEPATA
jgi:hypothetical protein